MKTLSERTKNERVLNNIAEIFYSSVFCYAILQLLLNIS